MSLLILEFPIKCQAYRIHQILVFKTLLCFIQKKKKLLCLQHLLSLNVGKTTFGEFIKPPTEILRISANKRAICSGLIVRLKWGHLNQSWARSYLQGEGVDDHDKVEMHYR